MITYQYVDPAATGLNTGVPSGTDPSDPTDPVNWNDAWVVLQSGINYVQESGVIFCRGTEYVLDAGGVSIGSALPAVKKQPTTIVGCNADGVIDGTKYEINGSGVGGSTSGLFNVGSADSWRIINVRCANGANRGWHHEGANIDLELYYCEAINSANEGFYRWYDAGRTLFFGCLADGNGDMGFDYDYSYDDVFIFCTARNNGAAGFNLAGNNGTIIVYGCLAHDNVGNGFTGIIDTCVVINCASDNNGGHGFNMTGDTIIIGCRATNHASGKFGFSITGNAPMMGYCYGGNNFADVGGAGSARFMPDRTNTDTNQYGSTDGYVDASGDNYNLLPGALARTIGVDLP